MTQNRIVVNFMIEIAILHFSTDEGSYFSPNE